jgi:hypothetical protein
MKKSAHVALVVGAALTMLCAGPYDGAAATSGTVGNSPPPANILAAGPMYGGPNQTNVVCYLFNAGPTRVSISTPALIAGLGGQHVTTLISNTCSSRELGRGRACYVYAKADAGQVYSCKVIVGPSKVDVRGALELRDAQFDVLQNMQLR